MIKKIKEWIKKREAGMKLENWYKVTWDDEFIYRNVSPPGQEPWKDQFKWNDIIRVCFEATDYLVPDDIYFFTSERPESYVIPMEANGGQELWNLVIEKGLFDAKLAIEAVTSVSGLFCWPKES